MTKSEARELEALRRENQALRAAIAERTPSPVFFTAGDQINGPPFYLPTHTPIHFNGAQVRLLEDGETIYVCGDDVLTVYPQASNVVRIHTRARILRNKQEKKP